MFSIGEIEQIMDDTAEAIAKQKEIDEFNNKVVVKNTHFSVSTREK